MGGLIYVVIMAVWAVVLVPAWLRRHDHEDPSRSVDRWSRSMRLLAKPPTVSSEAPERDFSAPASPARPEVRVVSRPAPSQARAVRERPAPSRAAKRRRVVLAGLSTLLVALGVLSVIGLVPPFVMAAPIILIASFVALSRAQVRSSGRARDARLAAAPRPAPATAPARRLSPGIHADGTWDAQASPLPSYVTAPPASSVPRVIDTETPGAWTAAAMLERVEQERRRAERLEQAKVEAIARARAEQAAAEARSRDEEYLAAQQAAPNLRVVRRRAVNE